MANIRKQFNFRNGVQVDDDNLVVNSTGLVGIGTSVPNEALDVRGNAKIVGVLTATQLNAESLTVLQTSISNITLTGVIAGSGVSVGNGIVTSSTGPIGLVTYYGDGRFLQGLPTSQWVDVDVGLGFTSIYAQGYVGVGTIDPRFVFQVAGTPNTTLVGFTSGVGISSEGNILATGIVTAYKFSGIGSNLSQLNASSVEYGTLNNSRLPQNISISGILTASTSITTGNISASGIVTASLGLNAGNTTIAGDTSVTGNVNATGIATFGPLNSASLTVTGNTNITGIATVAGGIVGDVTGTASTARSLTGTPDVVVGFVTASNITVSNNSTSGISSVTNRLYIGSNIGLNTHSPTAEVHIVKNGVGGVHLTSTQESYVGVARSLSRGQLGGELRFGNLADTFSGQNSLDLVNYDLGSINQYIHRGAAGLGTGNFNWIYGQDQSAKMTLTYGGRLGIAKTNPDHELHVVGTSTITEDLYVGDDLFVHGDSSLVGDLTVNGVFTTNNITVLGGINANLNNTSGISTFYDIDVTNLAKVAKVAIGSDRTDYAIQIGNAQNSDVLVLSNANFIGIGTSLPTPEVNISAQESSVIIRAVGVGTTRPRSAADFADAGKGYFSDSKRFLITPRVTTAERNVLDTSTVNAAGAIVYNTQLGVHQAYNGTVWADIGSGGGGTISFADRAGIATYSSIAGFSTDAGNVIGGIVTCTSLSVFPGAGGGISTFSGITTVTGPTLFAKQLSVSGVSTFIGIVTSRSNLFIGNNLSVAGRLDVNGNSEFNGTVDVDDDFAVRNPSGGDKFFVVATTGDTIIEGSIDANGGLDVLGHTELDQLNVSGITTTSSLNVGTGVTISAGIVTATNGFLSGIGTAVQITTVGNQLVFTVPGVGSTSFTLS